MWPRILIILLLSNFGWGSAVIKIPLKRVTVPRSFLQVASRVGSATPEWLLVGQIQVGTPPKTFRVTFDTGSGNLVLPGPECKDVACKMHHAYFPALSVTADESMSLGNSTHPEVVSLNYNYGSVTGLIQKDRVCLGADISLCCKAPFVVSSRMSSRPFAVLPYDGILGLGLPQTSVDENFNIFYSLSKVKAIPRNMFAIWMTDGQDGEDGEITIGGWNQDRLASRVVWIPAGRSSGLWEFPLQAVFSNDTPMNFELIRRQPYRAALDSGTAFLAGEPALIDEIGGMLGVAADCSNLKSLPLLGFKIHDHVFKLKSSDYVRRTPQGCFPMLSKVDMPRPRGPVLLLGYPFLKRYYTIYDRGSLSVGIAVAAHRTGVEETMLEQAKTLVTYIPPRKS